MIMLISKMGWRVLLAAMLVGLGSCGNDSAGVDGGSAPPPDITAAAGDMAALADLATGVDLATGLDLATGPFCQGTEVAGTCIADFFAMSSSCAVPAGACKTDVSQPGH